MHRLRCQMYLLVALPPLAFCRLAFINSFNQDLSSPCFVQGTVLGAVGPVENETDGSLPALICGHSGAERQLMYFWTVGALSMVMG